MIVTAQSMNYEEKSKNIKVYECYKRNVPSCGCSVGVLGNKSHMKAFQDTLIKNKVIIMSKSKKSTKYRLQQEEVQTSY